ncbi:MAG: Gfo/Idh/MocA family oxidoreductase, partial [Candidatus Dormibacteraceae bacterium]
MAIFKLALAGAGRMGRNHLRAIAESDRIRVTAIAEPGTAARASLQGTDAKVYADLEAMLDAGGFDAVLVCVPSDVHLQTIRRLVASGIPI